MDKGKGLARVVCLRWGDKYGAEYVNRLRVGVDRHLQRGHTFHCFCTSTYGIDLEVDCQYLVDHREVIGYWGKLQLPALCNELFSIGDPVLYIDLDTLIVGGLDPIFTDLEDDYFHTMADVTRECLATACMRWTVGSVVSQSFAEWEEKERHNFPGKFRGDQDAVTHGAKTSRFLGVVGAMPNNWFCNYKFGVRERVLCEFADMKVFRPRGEKSDSGVFPIGKGNPRDKRWHGGPPEGTKMVMFSGFPKIAEVAEEEDWVKQAWEQPCM